VKTREDVKKHKRRINTVFGLIMSISIFLLKGGQIKRNNHLHLLLGRRARRARKVGACCFLVGTTGWPPQWLLSGPMNNLDDRLFFIFYYEFKPPRLNLSMSYSDSCPPLEDSRSIQDSDQLSSP